MRGGRPLGPDLLSFWRWSGSDLVGNTGRGVLAEYIVAVALGIADGVQNSWEAWDLTTPEGVKVEVKSSAYLQTWQQREYSKITFGVGARYAWDPRTNAWGAEKRRHSDVFVFCVFAHKDPDTADPLNLDQWEFYVLATRQLARTQRLGDLKTVGLPTLLAAGALQVRFEEIAAAVRRCAAAPEVT